MSRTPRRRRYVSVDSAVTFGIAIPRVLTATGVLQHRRSGIAPGHNDGADEQNFDAEMQSFFLLFNRYLTERAKGEKL